MPSQGRCVWRGPEVLTLRWFQTGDRPGLGRGDQPGVLGRKKSEPGQGASCAGRRRAPRGTQGRS